MADVNGDGVLDLLVGTGAGACSPRWWSTAVTDGGLGPFSDEIARFSPFDADFNGGVSVAGADIDGNALADNIIVGSGPGMDSQVKVFSSHLPSPAGVKAPDVFSTFTPYPGSTVGSHPRHRPGRLDARAGPVLVDRARARRAGARQNVPLGPVHARLQGRRPRDPPRSRTSHPTRRRPHSSWLTTSATPDGVSLAAGWVAGAEGGAKNRHRTARRGRHRARVVDRAVRAWTVNPAIYLENPNHQMGNLEFAQIAAFDTVSPAPPGQVTVATTSTTNGADLLVSGTGPPGAEVRKYTLARTRTRRRTPSDADAVDDTAGRCRV